MHMACGELLTLLGLISMTVIVVVLLTYNHVATISKAVESILGQELDYYMVINILDDCSTDGTSEICQEYQRAWPGRIVHFRNSSNLGVERNLKEGFMRISSRYIAFLEGDDCWVDPKKLQLQVDMLEAHPQCILSGHNVLLKDHVSGLDSFFVNFPKDQVKDVYTLEDDIAIHPSARVFRNCIDFSSLPDYMVLDTHLYRLLMLQGDCCYVDRVMSVYNKTGVGFWSGMRKQDKRLMTLRLRYASLQHYNFQHESEYYSRSILLGLLKRMFGVRLGWLFFYKMETVRLKLKYLGRG